MSFKIIFYFTLFVFYYTIAVALTLNKTWCRRCFLRNYFSFSDTFYSSKALSQISDWNHEAEQKSNVSKQRKKRTFATGTSNDHSASGKLENILSSLAFSNKLGRDSFVKSDIPAGYDRAKLKYCFELADIVVTTNQKRDFRRFIQNGLFDYFLIYSLTGY